MPESHTLGARGCVGILENNKSKATMILNVARMCLRLSIQRSKCLRIASAMQVIRCLAPNVLSRPILRKTLTFATMPQSIIVEPSSVQRLDLWLCYGKGVHPIHDTTKWTQFPLLNTHQFHILSTTGFFNNKNKTTLTCTEPKPFDHHPVRSLAHYPKRGEEGLKRQASPTCVTTIYHQISVNFDPGPKARTHKSSCVIC